MSIYITGDTHRDFSRIYNFCEREETTRDDIMIILGDSGINYYLMGMDNILKSELELMPITLFCIHGNHEERPFNIPSYEEQQWHGGTVYVEPKYPSLIFAKDGEIYDFNDWILSIGILTVCCPTQLQSHMNQHGHFFLVLIRAELINQPKSGLIRLRRS